jgi:TfoX/Sxy family transcriptional regulator of competence genes
MATTQEFADYILDCVDDKRGSVRKMFGEFALYFDKKVVGLICDNSLFLKITEGSREIFEKEFPRTKKGPAYPGSKDFYIVGEEILENKKMLHRIMNAIWEDVDFVKKKKKK